MKQSNNVYMSCRNEISYGPLNKCHTLCCVNEMANLPWHEFILIISSLDFDSLLFKHFMTSCKFNCVHAISAINISFASPTPTKPWLVTRSDVLNLKQTKHIILQEQSFFRCCISSEKVLGPCQKSHSSFSGTRYLIQLSGWEARKFSIYIFICMSQ